MMDPHNECTLLDIVYSVIGIILIVCLMIIVASFGG